MSFFHYIINQKRNNFIKHCSPQCTKKPLISEMCIYIKSSLCNWGLGTLGGTMFYRQKIKGVSAYNTQNTLYPMENYVNRPLSDKSMKFCTVVHRDLTNDFSHNSKQNRSQNRYFLGKILQILCKNREKWENISRIHICWYIGMKFCTVVVHMLIKDISYDIRLNKSKICPFWGKIFEFRA